MPWALPKKGVSNGVGASPFHSLLPFPAPVPALISGGASVSEEHCGDCSTVKWQQAPHFWPPRPGVVLPLQYGHLQQKNRCNISSWAAGNSTCGSELLAARARGLNEGPEVRWMGVGDWPGHSLGQLCLCPYLKDWEMLGHSWFFNRNLCLLCFLLFSLIFNSLREMKSSYPPTSHTTLLTASCTNTFLIHFSW